MQEFSEIIKAADIEVGGVRPLRSAVRPQEAECPICGGSGYILRPDGRAQLCRCHAERHFQQACRAARLQPALQKMTFERFELANYPGNAQAPDGKGRTYYELAKEACAKMRGCCEKLVVGGAPRGLLLLGQVGSGKTHLAAAAVNYLLERERRNLLFTGATDFFEELKSSFDADEESKSKAWRLQQKVKKVPFLVIDDLGSHNFSDWARSVLFTILNYRLNEMQTTIITTNLNSEQLRENLGNRLMSRLVAQCQPCLLLANNDLRLQRSDYR